MIDLLIEVILRQLKMTQERMHGIIEERDKSNRFKFYFSASARQIELIKKFLSLYITHCNENKYTVLNYLMQQVVLKDKKYLRNSFIDELLESSNQLLVSESLLLKLPVKYSLSHHH